MSNRIAFITGASRGIGRETALTLARLGHFIVIASPEVENNEKVATEIREGGGEAMTLDLDISSQDSIKQGFAKVFAEKGRVDILVNNAGITRDGLLFRMSEGDWNEVIATNLTSCFHWTKHLARPMTRARWGRIVNITSVSGIMGNAGQANYSAAKAGMIGLTKTLAREFAGRSVTVNAVAPGFIKTDMTTEFVNNPEISAKVLEAVPLKRFGEAADIAHMTAYLCSEEAGYITGQVFAVDGGMAM